MTDSLATSALDPYALAMPREFILENGLRIVTLSTPTLKSADVKIIFDTGARDDPPGEEGTAHFLEHMMFNGTLNRHGDKKGVLPMVLQAARWGGSFGAQTAWNQTEYSMTAVLNCETPDGEPRRYLEPALDLLLDILQYPRIKQDEMERELSVIKTELATQTNAMDTAAMYSGIQSVIPEASAIHTIGTNESLDKLNAEKIRAFWKRYYVPSRTTIFIQGQGTDQELLQMVTDRLSVLGAHHDASPSPKHLFTPGESRISAPGAEHALYQFTWDMASAQGLKMNVREEITAQLMCALITQYLIGNMRDEQGLIYHAACSPDSFGNVKIQLASDKKPETMLASLSQVLHEFIKAPNEHLGHLLEDIKLMNANAALHQLDKKSSNAFAKAHVTIAKRNNHYVKDRLAALNTVTLEDIQELATRILGKPFAFGLAGNAELIAQVPDKDTIADIFNLPANDKPLTGFCLAMRNPTTHAMVKLSHCLTRSTIPAIRI